MRTTNTISTIYNHSEPIFSIDTFVKKFSMVFGGASKSLNLHSFNGSLIAEQFLATAGTGCARYRPDGRLIASAHWDGSVRLWSSRTLRPLAVLRHHRDCVFGLDFNEAGMFATGSKDGSIALWAVLGES
jgi:WD40 repeat protein